jgi:hypothetical protein
LFLCFVTVATCVSGAPTPQAPQTPQAYRLVVDRNYNDGNGNFVKSLRSHYIGKRSAVNTQTGDDQLSDTISNTRHLIGKRSALKITDRSYSDGKGNFVSSSWTASSRPGLVNHFAETTL